MRGWDFPVRLWAGPDRYLHVGLPVVLRTRGWGRPALAVNSFLYQFMLLMGANHLALSQECSEASPTTQLLLPLWERPRSLLRVSVVLSASLKPFLPQIPDFKHRITVQASPGLDRRRNVFEVGAGDSPTFPRFRAIQCKDLALPRLPQNPRTSLMSGDGSSFPLHPVAIYSLTVPCCPASSPSSRLLSLRSLQEQHPLK